MLINSQITIVTIHVNLNTHTHKHTHLRTCEHMYSQIPFVIS